MQIKNIWAFCFMIPFWILTTANIFNEIIFENSIGSGYVLSMLALAMIFTKLSIGEEK